MALLPGGRTVYGQALGILMLDTRFPRRPGDVGNANTWPFPTQYRIVKGADIARIMGESPDPASAGAVPGAAHDLEAHGVRAITTSCGFLAVFQRELAAAVSVPVLTSSLLQVPIVSLLRLDQKVGVLTERPHLTERHFQGVGWSAEEIPVVLEALPPGRRVPHGLHRQRPGVRHQRAGAGDGRAGAAHYRRETTPQVGALVLECTNFVPYSQAMRRATAQGLRPVHTRCGQL